MTAVAAIVAERPIPPARRRSVQIAVIFGVLALALDWYIFFNVLYIQGRPQPTPIVNAAIGQSFDATAFGTGIAHVTVTGGVRQYERDQSSSNSDADYIRLDVTYRVTGGSFEPETSDWHASVSNREFTFMVLALEPAGYLGDGAIASGTLEVLNVPVRSVVHITYQGSADPSALYTIDVAPLKR